MRKVILLLLALAACPFAAISTVTLPNEDINGVDTPQVVWVDQNFDTLKVKQNQVIDTVNGLQAGTAAFTGLTASTPLYLNSSKRPTSGTFTGTGTQFVLSASPTLTGTLTAAAAAFSATLTASVGLTVPDAYGVATDISGTARDLVARSGTTLNIGENGGWTGADYNVASGAHSFGVAGSTRFQVNTSGATVTGTAVVSSTLTADSLISAKFYTEGTWTATFTGMTASVTGTARYVRVGKQVTLYLPALSGTSNSTAGNITGMPAAILPARTQNFPIAGFLVDNGNNVGTGLTPSLNIATSGDIGFSYTTDGGVGGGTGAIFTASGTKSMGSITLTYTTQ
jgi:hypothetical protein